MITLVILIALIHAGCQWDFAVAIVPSFTGFFTTLAGVQKKRALVWKKKGLTRISSHSQRC